MRYTATQYARALYELIEAHPTKKKEVVRQFTETLVRHNRLPIERAILTEFEREWYQRKGIKPVEITTAGEETVDEKKLAALLENKVSILEKTDPSLIAGIRIKVGDWQVDNTLKRRFSEIKNTIANTSAVN